MREYSVPIAYDVKPGDNITQDVFDHARTWPDGVGLRRLVDGQWVPVTWREFTHQVSALAAGLIGAGVSPGDRVALMSRTRFEWTLVDYAILSAGGITVPIYPTSSLEQVEWILGDSGATAVVVETGAHARMVAQARVNLPALGPAWVMADGGLAELERLGADVSPDEVSQRRTTRGAADLAEIVYTSGTTGRPKGCMLTHGNVVANAYNCMQNDGFEKVFNENHSTLLFLPLAHSYAQVIQYGALHSRTVLGLVDMQDAIAQLPAFQPTAVLSVPRLWEKAYNSAEHKAAAEGHAKIFAAAARTAIDYSQALDSGGPGILLRLKHALFDRLVYAKVRAALGGHVQYAWSAAAPLGPRLGHFFRGAGINVLEAYGLTETSPATNSNTPDAQKIGTVGRPIPGCTIRIAPDGEVLVKGHVVFQGYWNNKSATDEMIDEGGWLHTGDIGALDEDGFLAITGRKKDLIITSAGKNVAPAVLEDRLRSDWLISQSLVVGDNQPYIAALVTLDPEAFDQWKTDHHKPAERSVADLSGDPELISDVQKAVDEANKAVSRPESIRKFRILGDDFTEDGGQLTPTLKVRRYAVLQEFAEEIESIYSS
ncbi:MAG TPA: long-chain fatty acid--CoA ligase [Jatrophihabitans sp.]|uniref:AMP-dependent synthetase/ligase n=1 Tax=Jatrophihabitans sp. TaxID=1932789 RepID=UPI002E07EA0A|nr:long-chain fatty acid--CoA ligase [Jatrophihabitans sp.]